MSTTKLCAFLLSTVPLLAQSLPGIYGKLTDAAGAPFSMGQVTATSKDGTREYSAVPSASGDYRISRMTADTYTIRWNLTPGAYFRLLDVAVQATTGSETEVNFDLRLFPNVSPQFLVNALSQANEVSASGWFTWFGSNMASVTKAWSPGDFTGGVPPALLGGIEVFVNGSRAAAVSYVDAKQVNFYAQTGHLYDPGRATAEVCIRRRAASAGEAIGCVVSQPPCPVRESCAMAPFQPISPAFAALAKAAGRQYIAAFDSFGGLVGSPGYREVRPGEVLSFYGVDFGGTYPPSDLRLPASQALPLAVTPELRIGGVIAQIQYAGTVPSALGLYQVNAVVPDLPDGDQPVALQVLGRSTQPGIFLSVRR